MEMGQGGADKIGSSPRWPNLGAAFDKLKARAQGLSDNVKKIGKDDPRRMVHSLKVGAALTLVSLFYYVSVLFDGFGTSAMWAVLTVVVVMEYTVGGTLSKGLNRAFATSFATAVGLGAHHVAILCGERGEPILLGLFVFLLAAAATFSRFVPEIKARYDYAVTIFILTFSLVAVSSYRTEELVQLAHQRVSTIAIGVAICFFTSICVFPVWAGEDLHNQVADNLDKLASFLQGLGAEYFGEKVGDEALEGKSFPHVYKSVLNSKPTEDSLANFARWEPGHGCFGFRHPWKQYIKIGTLCRQCACAMEAFMTYPITYKKIKGFKEPELRRKILLACLEMSKESGNALIELASNIRTVTIPSTAKTHIIAATTATTNLKATLSEEDILPEILHTTIAATLLLDIVKFVQQIVSAVEELASLANFKNPKNLHYATVMPLAHEGSGDLILNVEER